MNDKPYQPQGYCPDCGYHMDPGTCPECGSDISPGNLDKEPFDLARRRMIRYGLRGLLVLLIIGTVYFLWAYPWERYFSTATLLDWQGKSVGRVTCELVRRLENNYLTANEAERFGCQCMDWSADLNIRQPHPREIAIQLAPEFYYVFLSENPAGVYMDTHSVNTKVFVDDREVPSEGQYAYGMYSNDIAKYTFYTYIESLPPGKYTIRMEASYKHDFRPLHGYSSIKTFQTRHIWQQDIMISDVGVEQYAKPVWSEELAKRVLESKMDIDIGWDKQTHDIKLAFGLEESPANLAMRIQYRFDPTQPWRSWDQDSICDYGVARGENGNHILGTQPIEAEGVSDVISIRLVPDAQHAFHLGYDEYFDGIIEWPAIKLVEKGHVSIRIPRAPLKDYKVYRNPQKYGNAEE